MGNKAIDKSYLLQTLKDFTTKIISPLVGTKISEPVSEGSDGQVLTTDGNGNRTWTTVSSGSGGMNTDGSNADSAVTFANSAFTIGSRASSYDLKDIYTGIKLGGITLPVNCSYTNAVIYNNKIHILGGSGNNAYYSHYSWDDENSEWVSESTLPFGFDGSNGRVIVYDNKIHLLKGRESDYQLAHYSWDGESWVSESTLPYQIDYGTRAVVYHDKLYILGGSTYSQYFFAWDGTSWTQKSTLPYQFNSGSTVVYNDKIYILGGVNSGTYTYCYKWNGTSWASDNTTIPYQFYNGAAVVYDNKLYIFGSENSSYRSSYAIAELNSSSTLSWTYYSSISAFTSINTNGFYYGSALVYDNKIVLIGGAYSPNTIGSYEPNRNLNAWSKLFKYIPYKFTKGSAVVYNGKIHIMGGNTSENVTKHYIYNGYGEFVSESTLPYQFCCGAAVVYDNKIHIFGGGFSNNNPAASQNHYSYNNDGTWTKETDMPFSGCLISAVVYDNNIHIFGGDTFGGNYHSIWNGTSWDTNYYPPQSCGRNSCIVYDGKIHLFYDKYHYSWDSTSPSSWTMHTSLPYSYVNGGIITYNNKIMLIGTSSGTNYNKILVWDDVNDFEMHEIMGGTGLRFYNGAAVVYDNKPILLGTEYSGGEYNWYELDVNQHIVEISNFKNKTFVCGDQSVAQGDYSVSIGNKNTVLGNNSFAEGNNGYIETDMTHTIFGSSKISDLSIGRFVNGVSLYGNVLTRNNTIDTPLNGKNGVSGIFYSGVSKVYISKDKFGLYVMYMGSIKVNNAIVTASPLDVTFITGTSTTKLSGSLTAVTYGSEYDGEIFYINYTNSNYAVQFTLIRLA